jgi:hypothetical protein
MISTKISYKCEQCGLPVMIFKDKEPLKICKHDSAIIASIKSKVTLNSKFNK